MNAVYILLLSVILQFAAAFLAFKLIGVTKKRLAWVLISAAIFLMAIRRLIPILHIISGDISYTYDIINELVGLILSAFMVTGVALIAPVFFSIKRSEEALRESKKWLFTTLKSIGDAVIATDTNNHISFINPNAQTLTGWKKEEAIRRPLEDVFIIIDEKTGKRKRDPTVSVIQNNDFVGVEDHNDHNTLLVSKNGTKVAIDYSVAPIKYENGNIIGVVLVFHNITEHKQAEETIKLAHRELNQIFNTAADGMRVIDKDFNVIRVNQRFSTLLGMSKDEIIGQKCYEIFPGSTCHTSHCSMKRILSGEDFLEYDIEKKRKNGEKISCIMTATPLRKNDGELIGIVEDFKDITERKQMAEELIKAKEKAEIASQAKTSFLSHMSHEIRNPLNGIVGAIELLEDVDMIAEYRQYINIIKYSSDTLMSVINDILDFSKIEAGQLELDPIDFNLYTFVESIGISLSLQAEKKHLNFIMDIAPEIPKHFYADANRLRQIMFNLIGNAIKFTKKGKVVLKIENEASNKELTMKKAAKCTLQFSVSDTGIGIPSEKQRAIFDAFNQADSSITNRYGGTGLGLAICKQLIKLMGGHIWVESPSVIPKTNGDGPGCSFHFTLTLSIRNKKKTEEPEIKLDLISQEAINVSNRGIHILLVEDNLVNQKIMADILRMHNFSVDVAGRGEQVLQMLHIDDGNFLQGEQRTYNTFDMVLMDVQMPGMSGLEVTRIIREKERVFGAHIPILGLSAHAAVTHQKDCLKAGMDFYLTKPIKPEKIIECINRLLACRRSKPASDKAHLFS